MFPRSYLQVLILRVAASSDHEDDYLSGRPPCSSGSWVSAFPELGVKVQVRFVLLSVVEQTVLIAQGRCGEIQTVQYDLDFRADCSDSAGTVR